MKITDIAALTGLEVLEAIRDGGIPHPSMAHTLGFRLTDVSDGRAVITGETGTDYCNPNGTIHGGWSAAVLDSAMGSAVHSTLPAGADFTILDFKIDFVRTVTKTTGKVEAEGTIVQVGTQIGRADGIMRDANGRILAKGTTTCLIFRK